MWLLAMDRANFSRSTEYGRIFLRDQKEKAGLADSLGGNQCSTQSNR
jgi:hypothetical protein